MLPNDTVSAPIIHQPGYGPAPVFPLCGLSRCRPCGGASADAHRHEDLVFAPLDQQRHGLAGRGDDAAYLFNALDRRAVDGQQHIALLHAGQLGRAGVQQGDVLVAVNGTPVQSVEQVRAAVAKSDKSVALLIQRGGARIFVPVRLG